MPAGFELPAAEGRPMQHAQYRPIGAGQIVGQAVEGYRRLFRHLVLPTVLIAVPALAIVAGLGSWGYFWLRRNGLVQIVQHPTVSLHISPRAVGRIEVATALAGLVILLAMALMSAVTSVVVSQGYIGAKPSWQLAFKAAFRRLGSLLLVYLLVALLMLVLDVPNLVLALLANQSGNTVNGALELLNLATSVVEIYLAVSFSILAAVVVLEGRHGAAAIRRSVSLVRGRWWATLGTLVLVALVEFVAMIAASVVVGLAFAAVNSPVGPIAVLTLVICLLFPLQAVALTLIYFDLRNRHGGIDLIELARRVGVQPSGLPPNVPPMPPPPPAEWKPVPPDPGAAPKSDDDLKGAPLWPSLSPKPSPSPTRPSPQPGGAEQE